MAKRPTTETAPADDGARAVMSYRRDGTAKLASKFLAGKSNRRLTVKMLNWLRSVALHENDQHAGSDKPYDFEPVFFSQTFLVIKDAEARDFARVTILSDGSGVLNRCER